MNEEEPLMLDCEEHGRGVATVVCRHLCHGSDKPLGFIENSTIPGDWQAWCQQCEDFFIAAGEEMTPAFREFNDMALICESCYEIAKSKHSN